MIINKKFRTIVSVIFEIWNYKTPPALYEMTKAHHQDNPYFIQCSIMVELRDSAYLHNKTPLKTLQKDGKAPDWLNKTINNYIQYL